MKYFYAIYDFTAKKSNAGFGFANAKKAIAFTTKKARDEFVDSRKYWDFSCDAITRKQAMTMLESIHETLSKGLPVDSIDAIEMVTLWESRY